jgi:hypothetical protein
MSAHALRKIVGGNDCRFDPRELYQCASNVPLAGTGKSVRSHMINSLETPLLLLITQEFNPYSIQKLKYYNDAA